MTERALLRVLGGESVFPPPVWLMRQAGRYLPEYRETRARAGSFLDLCYDPALATEVTLQPIRRFGFDASILFSDILVIPDALHRNVRFVQGEGPQMDPISVHEIRDLDPSHADAHLAPVIATVARLRAELPAETALIGFCGAPWTVATYMIAGHGTPTQAPARLFGYEHPDAMDELLALLAEMSADYLVRQLQAGADCVQIFDSWAGVLDDASFRRWSIAPTRRIVERVRASVPGARIIGFPKGAGAMLEAYREGTGVDALGLDWGVPFAQARELQRGGAVQGNLDPLRLIAGGQALDDGVRAILHHLGAGPLVFNLGHGITPEAPIAHVERLLQLVRHDRLA
ncbi:uroporphyrinogen decarboxylase [Aureimonas jatrophae]|uniref:Uroporphyrinogen decarboxylase n=1 Tax=Aureimonas jatrophae TaxID=1166073 RepID=A0A1H0K6H6_9HYPH|nr:uroporphyrinogen decarboxylase [Aureimonas jatrophae]MBB3950967.1 uroporphyrinogen decarboxylase [Aureimonas jatrophae]SDO51383.1 uroporphyrinogen decarboxylase [Aureimonas jatrophae]